MKISKIFTSLALIGILSGAIYAETPDEEIASKFINDNKAKLPKKDKKGE